MILRFEVLDLFVILGVAIGVIMVFGGSAQSWAEWTHPARVRKNEMVQGFSLILVGGSLATLGLWTLLA